MKNRIATNWRTSIILSLAAASMTGTAVTFAGPGCMNDQRYMNRGYYPYSPVAPQPGYGRPAPYGYYAAPAPDARNMMPRYNQPMTAQRANPGGVTRPATPVPASSRPAQATVAASSQASDAAGDAVTVRIYGMRFEPASLTVKPGTTVTWVQDSRMPHTVTGKAGGMRSNTLNTRQQFSHTFDAAGTYDYACDFHPSMQGSVIVEADGIGT